MCSTEEEWKEPETYFKWSISWQKYTANTSHSFHLPKKDLKAFETPVLNLNYF